MGNHDKKSFKGESRDLCRLVNARMFEHKHPGAFSTDWLMSCTLKDNFEIDTKSEIGFPLSQIQVRPAQIQVDKSWQVRSHILAIKFPFTGPFHVSVGWQNFNTVPLRAHPLNSLSHLFCSNISSSIYL